MHKIEVRSVYKRFKETTALNDVSVEFTSGKIYGIVGRNGSGKTVLLKCICGLMGVSSGEIIVDGKRIGKDIDFIDNVGIIIENPGFLSSYSGKANLKMLAQIRGQINDQRIEETIRFVGLDPDSKKHVGKYSLGMKQRLGIAQAIMEDPNIILLDEPLNGLDNKGAQEVRELLQRLKEEGKLILLCSHNPEDIHILCDHVYEMDQGVLTKRY